MSDASQALYRNADGRDRAACALSAVRRSTRPRRSWPPRPLPCCMVTLLQPRRPKRRGAPSRTAQAPLAAQHHAGSGLRRWPAHGLCGCRTCRVQRRSAAIGSGGAIRVNDRPTSDDKMVLTKAHLNEDGVIKLSMGKKKHVLLKAHRPSGTCLVALRAGRCCTGYRPCIRRVSGRCPVLLRTQDLPGTTGLFMWPPSA